jgi:hypothetical protein
MATDGIDLRRSRDCSTSSSQHPEVDQAAPHCRELRLLTSARQHARPRRYRLAIQCPDGASVAGMALIYQAQLTPSKIELLTGWLPSQPWWHPGEAAVEAIGAYRFDDPADEVGIETHLLTAADGQVAQVPLTYRGAPLVGAEAALIGTMQHSVLGQRWVYDASADPVYATALATTILTGGTQAELNVESDGRREIREPTVRVTGSGQPETALATIHAVTAATDQRSTTVSTGELDLVIRRVLGGDVIGASALTLTGVWAGVAVPVVLAVARASGAGSRSR